MVQAWCPHQSLRNSCTWLAIKTVTLLPVERQQPWATLVRSPFHGGGVLCFYIRFSPPYIAKATFDAVSRTYTYLTPDFWPEVKLVKAPFQEFTDHLAKQKKETAIPAGGAE